MGRTHVTIMCVKHMKFNCKVFVLALAVIAVQSLPVEDEVVPETAQPTAPEAAAAGAETIDIAQGFRNFKPRVRRINRGRVKPTNEKRFKARGGQRARARRAARAENRWHRALAHRGRIADEYRQRRLAPRRGLRKGLIKVTIGSQRGSRHKSTLMPPGYACPTRVSKRNWANQGKHRDAPDTFSVRQSDLDETKMVRVSVTRTDRAGLNGHGWSMNLQFYCERIPGWKPKPRDHCYKISGKIVCGFKH